MGEKTEKIEFLVGCICAFSGLALMFFLSQFSGCNQLISSCVGFIVAIFGATLLAFYWIDKGSRLIFGGE